MSGCLSSVLLLVLIVCSTSGTLLGQSADALKNKRAELLAEINANNRRLGDTRRNKAETVKHVVSHLFRPMLYTSLTTIAGFASLAATPIPPVP